MAAEAAFAHLTLVLAFLSCQCNCLWLHVDPEERLKITLLSELFFFFNQLSSLIQLIAQPPKEQAGGRDVVVLGVGCGRDLGLRGAALPLKKDGQR